MSDSYGPIDSFVNELKGNTGFLEKLLFPRIGILVGIVGVLIVIVLLIK